MMNRVDFRISAKGQFQMSQQHVEIRDSSRSNADLKPKDQSSQITDLSGKIVQNEELLLRIGVQPVFPFVESHTFQATDYR